MVRAWVELPAGAGWADIRLAAAALGRAGYWVAEVRGVGQVWLRLAGTRLEAGALWVMPP